MNRQGRGDPNEVHPGLTWLVAPLSIISDGIGGPVFSEEPPYVLRVRVKHASTGDAPVPVDPSSNGVPSKE